MPSALIKVPISEPTLVPFSEPVNSLDLRYGSATKGSEIHVSF